MQPTTVPHFIPTRILVPLDFSSSSDAAFEDPDTAALLNDSFVSIKVDREERPDVDAVYMEAVQALTGSGGWPMSVFLLPDGRPFFGGTYFPPDDRRGTPSFPTDALFARDLADRGQLAGNTVVVTVMTNLGFRRAMEPWATCGTTGATRSRSRRSSCPRPSPPGPCSPPPPEASCSRAAMARPPTC